MYLFQILSMDVKGSDINSPLVEWYIQLSTGNKPETKTASTLRFSISYIVYEFFLVLII